MSKRLSYEVIKASFESEGYTLLTKVYNSKQKLEYICKRGHRHSVLWGNWKRGHGCPYCVNVAKPTIEFIRAEFAKEGYTLLTKVYKNSKRKLKYICPRGHRHSVSWDNWNSKKKRRCPYCVGKGKPTIEFIRAEFAKEDYILLTTIYKNNYTKLDYICPRGHSYSVSWNKWQLGRRCPYCFGKMKLTIEFVRSEFAKKGYKLLTKIYENAHQKLEYICPKGHRHFVTWMGWNSKRKYNCPSCSNTGVSKWEKTVKGFLNDLDIDHVSNDKSQLINPKTGYSLELDIWFPDLNKAIECNGLYWHSELDRKKCDKIKKQLCKDQGIDLLVITDKEWNDDIDKCKNKIQEFLC